MSMYSMRVGLEPGGVLDGDDPLVGGLVGERRAGDEVADRVHALACDVRIAPSTFDQALLVERDARLVEAQPLDVGPAAGGDDQVVDLGRTRRRR